MEANDMPSFDRLDACMALLYQWIEAKPSDRQRVVETIIHDCYNELKKIENSVNGKFSIESDNILVEDKEAYLSFKDLNFTIEVGDNKIPCIAKIRINPCIKFPSHSFRISGDVIADLSHDVISNELSRTLKLNKIISSSQGELSKIMGADIWMLKDKEREYIIRRKKEFIEIYERGYLPFYSKIWIIITATSRFNRELKEKFCEIMVNKTNDLCDIIAGLYISSIPGGGKKVREDHLILPLHNINITSMISRDKKLESLIIGANEVFSQDFIEDKYLNNIIDEVFTNLCMENICGWRNYLHYDCIKSAKWRMVRSENTAGIYATYISQNSTKSSAIFHTRTGDFKPVDEILHAWIEDINTIL